MEPITNSAPVVAIVGTTASGKSALALDLAQQFNGEIIAADSRTVYRGMDIGTAKPTSAEQRLVPHHLLNITTPDKPITAAEFQRQALATILNTASRGNMPFLVGGTGLYIDAVLYGFSFRPPAKPQRRAALQQLSVEALQQELVAVDIPLPENERNPRHLIRQLETNGETVSRNPLRSNTLILGLEVGKEELRERIVQRVDAMFGAGLEQEVLKLAERYGWNCQPLQTIGYQEFRPYSEGRAPLEKVKEQIIQNTVRYAKRQRTWFRRNHDIQWICKTDEAVDLVTSLLNK